MFARIAVIGVCLLAAWPAAAYEFKCPKPGTEIHTTLAPSGAPIRYDSQIGLWCLRSRAGQPLTSDLGHIRFFPRDAQPARYEKYMDAASRLWPLSPGDVVKFLYQDIETGRGGNASINSFIYEHEISVGDPVTVTVAAGRFLTVPITDELRGTGGNTHRSQYVFYYAPEYGLTVKFEFKPIIGVGNEAKPWELTELKQP